MKREVETEAKRVDDDFVEVVTTIKEQMSNKEFYQHWANMTARREHIKMSISEGKKQIENLERQLDVQIEQIKEFEHEAKECEARCKGNVQSKP